MPMGSILPAFTVAKARAMPTEFFFAWGMNSVNELGLGDANTANQLAPIVVPPVTNEMQAAGIDGWEEAKIYLKGQHSFARSGCDKYLFAWGRNLTGELGDGTTISRGRPVPIEPSPAMISAGVTCWSDVEIFGWANSSFARSSCGQLFAWGDDSRGQLGTGNGGGGVHETRPVPVLLTSDMTAAGIVSWNDVEFSFMWGSTFAISTNGQHFFAWGANVQGGLGAGLPSGADSNFEIRPVAVPLSPAMTSAGITCWSQTEIFIDGAHAFASSQNGELLFAWGRNVNGELGVGAPLTHRAEPVAVPVSPAMISAGIACWSEMQILPFGGHHTFALSDCEMLFAWGNNAQGQLGVGAPLTYRAAPVPVELTADMIAAGVGSWNDLEIMLGGHYAFALTDEGQMFGWGRNLEGQVGDGSGENRARPVPVPLSADMVIAGVTSWNDVEMHMGYVHNFAHIPAEPLVVTINKTLQMPEGTTPPDTDTFTFDFRFVPIQIELTPQSDSRPIEDFPPITPNPVELALDGNTAVTANTVTTITGSLDLMDILGGLTFLGGGVFVWEVYEVDDSSGLTDLPNYEVIYDTSRFQIRVHVTSAGSIGAIEVFELDYDNGTWKLGDKVGELNFVNTFRKLTGPDPCPFEPNGVEVTKNVVGEFADLTTDFTFTLTLTEHFLAPLTFPIDAYHIDIAGDETALSIPAAAHTFTLRHGERLVIPQIWAGTNFAVNEHAAPNFIPSFRVTVGATQGNLVTGTVNTALATGTHIVWDTGRNAADYINTHEHTPPTGLFITSTPWVALGAAALLAGLLATSRNRRRIEQLPLVL